MKQLPTIEEFYIEKWGVCPMIEKEIALHSYYEMLSFAKEFAKLHVKAALESAAENARIKTEYYHEEDVGRTRLREILDSSDLASERTDGDGIMYAVDTYEVNKKSILNAYPLENIK